MYVTTTRLYIESTMPIAEIRVNSLGDLIDKVTPTEPDPRTGRRRDSGVYRGEGEARGPLLTSLDKLGGTQPPHSKADLEEHILRNFIRYSRPYLDHYPVSEWETLVSAHFDTRSAERQGGLAVWRLDWQRVHRCFGLPELALLIQDLEGMLGGDQPLTPWALFSAPAEARQFACMLEPPSLNARIVAQ